MVVVFECLNEYLVVLGGYSIRDVLIYVLIYERWLSNLDVSKDDFVDLIVMFIWFNIIVKIEVIELN